MRYAPWILAAMLIGGMGHGVLGATSQPASRPGDYDTEFQRSEQYAGPWTQQNLDRIAKGLEVPETRLTALRELIDFAGPSMYQVGSFLVAYPDGSGKLREQAIKIADKAADEATILKTLDSSDPMLVFWGIWHVGMLKDPKAVFPKLMKIARGSDESLRATVVEYLRHNGGAELIPQLAAAEKSPYVLEEILFGGNTRGEPEFNRRICALLNDSDPVARKEAVEFVLGNWISASMRQLWLNGTIMDGLLADAQPGHPEAAEALQAFQTYANQNGLTTADAAGKWWHGHRSDWELARLPRFERPNGAQIFASIVTSGDVGATPGWKATIIVENRCPRDVEFNTASISSLNWSLYDNAGERMQVWSKPAAANVNWVTLKPGESVKQDSPIVLEAGPLLKPGKYTLVAEMDLNINRDGAPAGVALYQGQIPLPAIVVEVVEAKN